MLVMVNGIINIYSENLVRCVQCIHKSFMQLIRLCFFLIFRTIFTKVARYHYVDPEFTYTVLEELEKQANRDHYADYIQNLRQRRVNKKNAK